MVQSHFWKRGLPLSLLLLGIHGPTKQYPTSKSARLEVPKIALIHTEGDEVAQQADISIPVPKH